MKCAKFQDDIFRGYNRTGGRRISHFPIDVCMCLTTVQRYTVLSVIKCQRDRKRDWERTITHNCYLLTPSHIAAIDQSIQTDLYCAISRKQVGGVLRRRLGVYIWWLWNLTWLLSDLQHHSFRTEMTSLKTFIIVAFWLLSLCQTGHSCVECLLLCCRVISYFCWILCVNWWRNYVAVIRLNCCKPGLSQNDW